MKRITLPAWAATRWDPPPPPRSLTRWARQGLIMPAPEKVGRSYYVRPDAKLVDRNGNTVAR